MVTLSYHLQSENQEGFANSERLLLLQAGQHNLSVILWNRQSEVIVSIEVFTQIEQWEEEWPLILQRSSLLHYKHLEAEIHYTSGRGLMLPGLFYNPALAAEHLAASFGEAHHQFAGSDIFEDGAVVLAWETSHEIYDVLSGHFNQIRHKSLGGILLQLGVPDTSVDACGHILVSPENAWLAVWRGKQLLLLSSIALKDPEEFSYHLLNICHQWGIDNEKMHWVISGMIRTDAPLWQVPEKYFPQFTTSGYAVAEDAEVPGQFYGYIAEYLKLGTSINLTA
jgi:hypothetical protein